MEKNSIFDKDPTARLVYGFDWTEWLPEGHSISTSNWEVPTGLVNNGEQYDSDTDITSVILSGGTKGKTYLVKNTIVTDGPIPLTDSRAFKINIATR